MHRLPAALQLKLTYIAIVLENSQIVTIVPTLHILSANFRVVNGGSNILIMLISFFSFQALPVKLLKVIVWLAHMCTSTAFNQAGGCVIICLT